MFEKFGEFHSAEELNRAAAAQLKEGDIEAIMSIAKENGISEDDAQDYIDGLTDEFVSPLMAALGRLSVEEKEMKTLGAMDGWIDRIRTECVDTPEVAAGVMKYSLEGCLGAFLKEAFEIKKQIPDSIVKAAGLRGPLYLGIPSAAKSREIIRKYYGG